MTQATGGPDGASHDSSTNRLKLAVTGGSGSIGTAVIKELLQRGHEVTVLDRRAPHVEGVRFVFINLADRQALQPVLEGLDGVIHLGEIPNEGRGESPHAVFTANTAAGSTVLQTAADLKLPRIIYTSSCQVYGLWGGHEDSKRVPTLKLPLDETHPLYPTNPYALAKAANEGYARIMAERQNAAVTIFRLPLVISGGRWIRQLMNWTRTPGWYRDHFDGFWSFVHDEDVARGFAAAIENPLPAGSCEAYNLIASDILGNEPIRERLSHLTDRQIPPLPDDWPANAAPFDLSKPLKQFGWSPRHSYRSLAKACETK